MRIQLGVTLLTTMATAAVLVAAAPASSSIAWSETAKVHGQPVLSFQVTALTVGKQGWSAHISFRNLTKHTVQVGTSFGLAFYPSSKITPATRPEAFGVA